MSSGWVYCRPTFTAGTRCSPAPMQVYKQMVLLGTYHIFFQKLKMNAPIENSKLENVEVYAPLAILTGLLLLSGIGFMLKHICKPVEDEDDDENLADIAARSIRRRSRRRNQSLPSYNEVANNIRRSTTVITISETISTPPSYDQAVKNDIPPSYGYINEGFTPPEYTP